MSNATLMTNYLKNLWSVVPATLVFRGSSMNAAAGKGVQNLELLAHIDKIIHDTTHAIKL